MTALLNLPSELTSQIMLYTSQLDRSHLLLVSRSFHEHFEPRLYERIDLHWNDIHAWGCENDPKRECNCGPGLATIQKFNNGIHDFANPPVGSLLRMLLREGRKRLTVKHLTLTGTPHKSIKNCCGAQDVPDIPAAIDCLELLDSRLQDQIVDGLKADTNVEAAAALLLHIVLPDLISLSLSQDFQHKFPLPMRIFEAAIRRDNVKLVRLDLCADRPLLSLKVHVIPRYSAEAQSHECPEDSLSYRDHFHLRDWWYDDPKCDPLSFMCAPHLEHFSCIMYSTPNIPFTQRTIRPVACNITSLSLQCSHISESDLGDVLSNTPRLTTLLFDCWWSLGAPHLPQGDWKHGDNPINGSKLLAALSFVQRTLRTLSIFLHPCNCPEDRDWFPTGSYYSSKICPIESLSNFSCLQSLQIPLCLLLPLKKHKSLARPHSIASRLPFSLTRLCVTDDAGYIRLLSDHETEAVDPVIDELISDLRSGDRFPATIRTLHLAISMITERPPRYNKVAGFEDSTVYAQISSLRSACEALDIDLNLLENPFRWPPTHSNYLEWTLPEIPTEPFMPDSYDPVWRAEHRAQWEASKLDMEERERYRAGLYARGVFLPSSSPR